MAASTTASYFILFITAALLFYVAVNDLRHYKIRNELVLVLGALFFAYVFVSGRWVELHWNVYFAVLMFILLLISYSYGLLGGGDVKLLTVAFLWSGPRYVIPFLVILLVASVLHLIAARLGWVHAQKVNGWNKVAFAPSVAAGLVGIFMLGYLTPV